jgi:cytidylate kinase
MKTHGSSSLNLHRYLASRSHEMAQIPKSSLLRPAVTISRETGAGAVTIGRRLAEVLEKRKTPDMEPWACYDKNLAEKVAEDHKLPAHLAQYMPESQWGEIESFLREVMGVHPPAEEMLQMTNRTMVKLAMLGNVILVGRGANIVTATLENAFHIRLVAPLKERIRRVEDYYKLSRDEAEAFIRRKDKERRDYVKSHFDENIDDPLLYHLVINTGLLSDEAVVQMVADALVARMKPLM